MSSRCRSRSAAARGRILLFWRGEGTCRGSRSAGAAGRLFALAVVVFAVDEIDERLLSLIGRVCVWVHLLIERR